jgi:hypothetical protein
MSSWAVFSVQNDNRAMRYLLCVLAVLIALGLAACSPTFNWREVRSETSTLVALLPCKPDDATRAVDFAGEPVRLDMLSCDTGGAMFAIGHVDVRDPQRAAALLAAWRAATLANFRATVSTEMPFAPKGSLALAQSSRITATGQRADGAAIKLDAAWFAQQTGSRVQLFQAIIFANKIGQGVSDTFFSALKLQ